MCIIHLAGEDGTIPMSRTSRKIFLMVSDPALDEERQIDLEMQEKSTQAQERGMIIPNVGALEVSVEEKAGLVANNSHVGVARGEAAAKMMAGKIGETGIIPEEMNVKEIVLRLWCPQMMCAISLVRK